MVEVATDEKIGFEVEDIAVYRPDESNVKILKRYDLKQYAKQFRVYKVKFLNIKGPKSTRMVHEKDLDIF